MVASAVGVACFKTDVIKPGCVMRLPDHLATSANTANAVRVENVGLTFTNGFVGLKATSLDVPGGTFCTLLGSSGSGKTTLLRAIAGLINPTSGRIIIGEADVTALPVQARNIGFVFQNYALFPHMNVSENIEYPLKLKKWSASERAARVKEILELIELPHVASRTVGQLSGGQQQRVAIGRALAYRPSVLLLDEPMGALDRRLRQQLGADLREMQQRTGITTIYVTHDQEEAFILSDKIAVMSHGEILQYSEPAELYARPRSRFIATFLGEANMIDVEACDGENVLTAHGRFPYTAPEGHERGEGGWLLVRPEDVRFVDNHSAYPQFTTPIEVKVKRTIFLGSRCLVTASAANGKAFLVECPKAAVPAIDAVTWIAWPPTAAVLLKN